MIQLKTDLENAVKAELLKELEKVETKEDLDKIK